MSDDERARVIAVEERRAVPLDGLLLGYGPMLPFPAAVVVTLLGPPGWAAAAPTLAIVWGASILLFLSGVRRGLSFRTPGGPRLSQMATMLWLFLAGLGAMVAPETVALGLLLAGYASLTALDRGAALREEAPLYFARLRPPQMAIAAASLGALLLLALVR